MRRASILLPLALLACQSPAPEAAKPEPAKVEAARPEPAAPEPAPAPARIPGDPNEACAKILVVAHAGVDGVDAAITRDEAAARARAGELLERLKGGASLAELAASESDDARTKAKLGGMGTFTRDAWPERFEALKEPIFALGIGEQSEPLATPLGIVIAERCPVEKIHTSHILVRYKGAKNADEKIRRSREQAKAEAEKIADKLAAGGDFAALARAASEDGSAERGGDLGLVGRGMFARAYEEAAFALAPGAVSPVIETDFGFHVIRRMPAEAAPASP